MQTPQPIRCPRGIQVLCVVVIAITAVGGCQSSIPLHVDHLDAAIRVLENVRTELVQESRAWRDEVARLHDTLDRHLSTAPSRFRMALRGALEPVVRLAVLDAGNQGKVMVDYLEEKIRGYIVSLLETLRRDRALILEDLERYGKVRQETYERVLEDLGKLRSALPPTVVAVFPYAVRVRWHSADPAGGYALDPPALELHGWGMSARAEPALSLWVLDRKGQRIARIEREAITFPSRYVARINLRSLSMTRAMSRLLISDGREQFSVAIEHDVPRPAQPAVVAQQVKIKAAIHGVDDEWIGENEEIRTSVTKSFRVGRGELIPKTLFAKVTWGGECRLEVYFYGQCSTSGEVTLQFDMLLYEGTSEDTRDLDGTHSFSVTVKPDKTVSRPPEEVWNTDEDSPDVARMQLIIESRSIR